ncbi:MAG TPA: histidine phosphatase family protein [Thermomicrobiales bacterium]|jgi:alpha-ribazole phosphatase/probable phosphoglycerate mutase
MVVTPIYETHSLTTDNETGVATDRLPGELSSERRRLARELGERRRDAGIAAVFVSDLARAVETAELAFGGGPVPIHQDARLRECNYGALNRMPVARLAAERARRITVPYPDGQSYEQVVDATADFLRDLVSDWDGRTVLVIAHSANKWAFDCLLNGARLADLVDAPFGWREGWHYTVPTGWARATGAAS